MTQTRFHFKQFSLSQEGCAMKVGTDGVLLGAWAEVPVGGALLDIGSGSGLLSLMAAQKGAGSIDAVEIDPVAASRARENVAQSPWPGRIRVTSCNIMHFTPATKYHLILTNPPFFQASLKAPDPARTMARHTDTLTPENLIQLALQWLLSNGHICLILPSETSETFVKEAMSNGLYLYRRCTITTKAGKPPKRTLLDLTPTPPRATHETQLILQDTHSNQRTQDYQNLTRDFYLDTKTAIQQFKDEKT